MGGPTRCRDRACRSFDAPQSSRLHRPGARGNRRRAFLCSAVQRGRAEAAPRDPGGFSLHPAVSLSRRLLRAYGAARRGAGDRRPTPGDHPRRNSRCQLSPKRRAPRALSIWPALSGGRGNMSQTRRLAAILAADVAGYSRLMGEDEDGTLARLKAIRRQLIDPKIKGHRGRIVKTTGDGLLAEFPSVVDAVRCAVEMQRGMLDREMEVSDERGIRFRIGINLGDVIADGDDIFGDGVNVAARLEALAEPGG